ncbi:MAG: PRC-barrel domain-containing protein [Rhizobiales bacterium]|nr:PRC-barrel domain-containing protein [Hyphomicrobiales bacterium]
MKHHNLIAASILALSIPGFAIAQTTTPTPSPDQPSQTQPATPDVTLPDDNTSTSQQTMPSDNSTAQQPTPTDQNKSSAEAPATTTGSSVIVSEAALSGIQPWTANEFIGKTVYTTSNENVGEINDLVLVNDGKIHGVVNCVGGFHGIGEKDELVALDSIRMTKAEGSDTVQLVVNATKEALENAPGFDRVAKRYMAPEPAPATSN